MNEGELLLLNPLPEEPPAGYRVAQYTHRVTEHDLQQAAESVKQHSTENITVIKTKGI